MTAKAPRASRFAELWVVIMHIGNLSSYSCKRDTYPTKRRPTPGKVYLRGLQ